MKLRFWILISVLLIVAGVLLAGAHRSYKSADARGKFYGSPAARQTSPVIPHGEQSLDVLYPSTDVPVHIPDEGTVRSTLQIPDTDNVTIQNLYVHLVIHHTWIRDLHATLINPDSSVRVTLFDIVPIDFAENMDAWFDDTTGRAVIEADTPIVGVFQPEQVLQTFIGHSSQGLWQLEVQDTFPQDTGSIMSWGLEINPAPALTGTVENSVSHKPIPAVSARLFLQSDTVLTTVLPYKTVINAFTFLYLTPGICSLQVFREDYETLTIPGIPWAAGDTIRLDTTLHPLPLHYEYASDIVSIPIPDGHDSATVPLTVSRSPIVGDLNVTVNISHSYPRDLVLWLQPPSGQRILLANQVGRNRPGSGFTNCRFDDSAAVSIHDYSVRSPFTGHYRPEEDLSVFRGSAASGVWNLVVVDSAALDSGFIREFAIEIVEDTTVAAVPGHPAPVRSFAFEGNYPNPFNSQTEFRFSLAERGRVDLVLYNTLGQKVADMTSGVFVSGAHTVPFNASGLASGVYIARLTVNGSLSQSRKVLLLK